MSHDKRMMDIILAMLLLGVIFILTGSYLFLMLQSFHGLIIVVIGTVIVAVLIAISRELIVLAITGGTFILIGCYLFFALDSSYGFVSVLMILIGAILIGVRRIFRRIT